MAGERRCAFHAAQHRRFLAAYAEKANTTDSFELWLINHKRMSGAYWTLTALYLLHCRLDRPDENQQQQQQYYVPSRDEIIEWVARCQHANGGFGGNDDQDPHVLYTLSAVQLLALYDALDDERVDLEAAARYVASLQREEDGAFAGDEWGEVDTRFAYCAALCLRLLGRMHLIDTRRLVAYVMRCENFDGGFGVVPGAESHAGQIFCALGTLALCAEAERGARALDDSQLIGGGDVLGMWLAERQMRSGGFNGRPDKVHDVCYSWWVLASLAMLGRQHWIDGSQLARFILRCQAVASHGDRSEEQEQEQESATGGDDGDGGGIADQPGDMPDVYHTFFGVAGLSLLGEQCYGDTGGRHGDDSGEDDDDDDAPVSMTDAIRPIDPVYALPLDVLQRLGLR